MMWNDMDVDDNGRVSVNEFGRCLRQQSVDISDFRILKAVADEDKRTYSKIPVSINVLMQCLYHIHVHCMSLILLSYTTCTNPISPLNIHRKLGIL